MEHLTASNFDEKVINADNPVVVDFYADWCGPCKIFGPVFEEVAGDTDGVDFYKVNVDDEGAIAQKFGVRSIPTIIFFKGGQRVEEAHGALPKEVFKQAVAQHSS